jgi:hypothetical protein
MPACEAQVPLLLSLRAYGANTAADPAAADVLPGLLCLVVAAWSLAGCVSRVLDLVQESFLAPWSSNSGKQ